MIPEKRKSLLIDLGSAVARVDFQTGCINKEGEFQDWLPNKRDVKVEEVERAEYCIFFEPASDGCPAQSVTITREGIEALIETFGHDIPYGREYRYRALIQEATKDQTGQTGCIKDLAKPTDDDIPF